MQTGIRISHRAGFRRIPERRSCAGNRRDRRWKQLQHRQTLMRAADCRPSARSRPHLQSVVAAGGNGGLANDMWATVVNRDGIVARSHSRATARGDQWPGSRVISAQKANTANAFSRPNGVIGFAGALSTANLYSAVQPGGSLFGLQESNPVRTAAHTAAILRAMARPMIRCGASALAASMSSAEDLRSITRTESASAASVSAATPPALITSWPGKCASLSTWTTWPRVSAHR